MILAGVLGCVAAQLGGRGVPLTGARAQGLRPPTSGTNGPEAQARVLALDSDVQFDGSFNYA